MTEEPGSAERAEFRFNARASLSSALVAGRLAWLASPGWTTSALAMLCAAFMPTFQELDTVQALAGIFVYVIDPALADRPVLAAWAMLAVLIACRSRHWVVAISVRAWYWLLAIQPLFAALFAVPRMCAYPLGWAAWPQGGVPLLILDLLYVILSGERWVQRACADALLLPFGPGSRDAIGGIAAAYQSAALARSRMPAVWRIEIGFLTALTSCAVVPTLAFTALKLSYTRCTLRFKKPHARAASAASCEERCRRLLENLLYSMSNFFLTSDPATHAAAEQPADASPAAAAEPPADASPVAAAEQPADASPAAAAEPPADASPVAAAEQPADASSAAPAEQPADASPAAPAEQPADASPAAAADTAPAVRKRCAACGATRQALAEGEKLRRCGRCLATYYCSQACQRDDWQRHKGEECRRLRTARADSGSAEISSNQRLTA